MFVAADSLRGGESLLADLLIVGTGPAGLLIASELIDSGLRIVMLESGARDFSRKTQLLNRAEIVGAPNHPGTHSRYRVYGGSTTRWGGQCVPFEPIDFEAREEIAESGWSITSDEMAPWYDRAAERLGLGDAGFSLASWEQKAGRIPALTNDEITGSTIAFAQPLDLGAELYDTFAKAENLTVITGANVQSVGTDPEMTEATEVRFATLDGAAGRVLGKRIVLACGGIENARLLLASQDHSPAGIGNRHDVVGRYFMDHPYLMPAWLDPAAPGLDQGWHVIETFDDAAANPGAHAVFTLDPELRRREGLPGCVGYFMRREAWQLEPSYMSRGGSALTHFAEILRGDRVPDEDVRTKARDLVLDAPSTLKTLGNWATATMRSAPRAALRICMETTPNRDSRITLSDRKDALGQPLARVDWRINDQDWQGLSRFRSAFAEAVSKSGLGRLVDDPTLDANGYPLSMVGGRHHMGSTRLHSDPKRGVVDTDLRVHGMKNLYIAGSSVFPTGGWANPTFTIAALSLRLADHLRRSPIGGAS